MKKTILPLLLFTFILGLNGIQTTSHITESAIDAFDNKTSINIRKLEETTNDVSYSKMFTQYAKKDNKYYLRFATAIKGNVNSIKFVREIDGLPNNDKECTTLYKGISANNKTLYYDGTNAVEEASDLTNDYYWACYTIQFKDDTYLNKDITLSMYVNGDKTSVADKTTTLKFETQIGVVSKFEVTKNLDYTYLVGEDANLNDIVFSTIDLNGNKVEDIDHDKIRFYENDHEVDTKNLVYTDEGSHTLTAKYKEYSTDFTFTVAKNIFEVEAENIYNKDLSPKEKNVNYVERINYKDGTSLKPMIYRAKQDGDTNYALYNKIDARNSSGQAYLGEAQKNNVLRVHIYSGVERVVKAYMTASSAAIEKDTASWVPIKMFDMELAETIESYGNGEKLTFDNVTIKGGEIDANASKNDKLLLFATYSRVCVGEFALKKGDNTLDIKILSTKQNDKSITHNNGSINIDKFDFVDAGMRVEAENIANKGERVANSSNYCERVNASGNQLGKMLFSNGKADAKFASGQGYLGEIKASNSMNIHIWSEMDRKVAISMTASSGVIKVDSDKSWEPFETSDIQLNKIFRATANGNSITITDDVVLPGKVTPFNEDGTRTYDPLIWANWQTVEFGEMELKKGDNIIYIELTNAITFTGNITKDSGTINIDKFDIKYLD